MIFSFRWILLPLLLASAPARAQSWGWDDGTVPYVQTPMEIVERMLRMAEGRPGDSVIDLGSGDGRIVIASARPGARGLGGELDPNLGQLATQNPGAAGRADPPPFATAGIFRAR